MLQYDSKPIPFLEYEGSLRIGKTYRLFSPFYPDHGLVIAYRCHVSASIDRSKLRDPPHHRFNYPDGSLFVINDTDVANWKIALARPAEFSTEQRYHDQERFRVTKEHRMEDRDIKAKKLLEDLEEAYTCVVDDEARCRYARKFSEKYLDDQFYALRGWLAYAGSNTHKQIATEFFTPAKLKVLDQATLLELKKKCGIEYTPPRRREKKVPRNQDADVPDSWEEAAKKL